MIDTVKILSEKIMDRSAIIGIVGMGYVGQPLALRFSEVGFKVIGFDHDRDKVSLLNSGKSEIEHISNERVEKALSRGFRCTSDMAEAAFADALILCVPTPLTKYREPDLSYVLNTLESLVPFLRMGHLIALESTTYPGTTEEQVVPRVQSTGLRIGSDVFVVYSPEREDPGNKDFATQSIPKIVGGHTRDCLGVGATLYQQVIETVVEVSSPAIAEMAKLLENIHRAVNIGLVNEMKVIADRMGIDIFEVIDAAGTKPFGFTPYYPGPGIGGHCIPVDPFYLTWKAREYGVSTRFIELSGEINNNMPNYVVQKLKSALNEKCKSLKSAKILVLGIAYKKDVDDMRESPAVVMMELMRAEGADVYYSDPHVPVFPEMRNHSFNLKSIDLSEKSLAVYDAVLLATDHSSFDYEMIQKCSSLIVDSRGVYRDKHLSNVARA
tara:strand:+ start:2031 stop:3347 length:1317 start_codon:yes stop_codon:yes gene_type:complete